MLNKNTSDFFNFTLFIKYAEDPYPFLLVPFRVDFTETDALAGYAPDSPENGHRFGFAKGRPTVAFRHVTDWADDGSIYGPVYYACDYDDGTDEYIPFAYQDDDGSVVINTDSEAFQRTMDNVIREYLTGNVGEGFLPGSTYYWNLYGNSGGIYWNNASYPLYWYDAVATNAAYFTKGFNANSSVYLGCSYGSYIDYGFGSPAGWFTLIIAADAK
jgi:hypothetical protein